VNPRVEDKVIAVFASSSPDALAAIEHIHRGNVHLPVFLFCLEVPSSSVTEKCAQVIVCPNPLRLVFKARTQLSCHWVALGIAAWNRKPGSLLIKIAPFLFPPFRVLLMNEHRDFFPGRPHGILKHCSNRLADRLRTAGSWIKGAAHVLYSSARTACNWIQGAVHLLYSGACEVYAEIDLPGPFELVAQFSSPLSRFVFSHLSQSEVLVVSARRATGYSAVAIHLPQGEWRRDEILRALSGSLARWVVFIDTDSRHGDQPWTDMLPLFDEPRTFAAARQVSFQGWLKSVLPSAPFRVLQPDEASQVLAPVSSQIVFDREHLLALGLPNLRSAAANFCLLFWQAAAAGWRCYSVGSRQAVTQLPAMPQCEAQFVQALVRDPAVAHLQPRELALSRGSIARRIAGPNSFRGLPRILVVSPYLPFPLTHGGAVRIYNLCRSLSRDFDLVLACFREKDDFTDHARLHEIFREVYVVSIDEVHNNPALPLQVTGYESSAMRALIPQICAERRIDILQLEYTQMAAYRETVPHLPAILVEHDITFSLYEQLAHRAKTPSADRAYESWRKFESGRLQAFDMVWTMSESDRVLAIEAGATPEQVAVVSNGVDIEKFHGGFTPDVSDEILYIGSFRHLPNYLAFRELCDVIMPLVWLQNPNATLRVVAGPHHEAYWPGSHHVDSRITVHGFVSDVAALYRNCALTVAPLPVSAGTNIKVMETLASERALVTTPIGCAGLGLRHGIDALICDLGSEFADAICHLLRNPTTRRTLARHGRKTAEDRFSWESIKDRAAKTYEALVGQVGNLRPNGIRPPAFPTSLPGNRLSAHQT
jgi:glycosyltransferase involved in cell wall biosynthesis